MSIVKTFRKLSFTAQGQNLVATYKLSRNFKSGSVHFAIDSPDATSLTIDVYGGNDLDNDSQQPVEISTGNTLADTDDGLLLNITTSLEYIKVYASADTLTSTADLNINIRGEG